MRPGNKAACFRACSLCSFAPPGRLAACVTAGCSIVFGVLVHRAFRAQRKEDTMTTYDTIQLIQALAYLISALAQLVAALRRPPP